MQPLAAFFTFDRHSKRASNPSTSIWKKPPSLLVSYREAKANGTSERKDMGMNSAQKESVDSRGPSEAGGDGELSRITAGL